tara:strand:- start:92 stop:1054 length:963 start_codon:yes stop_codon:yes gene_type:complete
MEIASLLKKFKPGESDFLLKLKGNFFKKSSLSKKKEINVLGFKWIFLTFLTIFISYVLFMPDENTVEFSEKIKTENSMDSDRGEGARNNQDNDSSSRRSVWSNSSSQSGGAGASISQINYNTPMVIGSSLGNAKNQFRAGIRIPLRVVDKFIVSQDSVPILAESILDSMTESGIRIPAGTRFYGEATFQRGSERAQIVFKQMSLPSGEIKTISAIGIDKDGQSGVYGKVFSDGVKNSTGQIITTFVGGLAAGSIETDAFGRSRGGVENGLLAAVSETAKSRAQNYGEKLKTEREWIEVQGGAELDALLKETLNLNDGGAQ